MPEIKKKYAFPKREKLCSRKEFTRLFMEGSNVFTYPFKIQYLNESKKPAENENIQVGVSVSKKNIKKAWQRNKVKRRIREAWRLNCVDYKEVLHKNELKVTLVIIYVGVEVLPYEKIESSIKQCIRKLFKTLDNR
jgi:ribonuclease P protein component